jgi:hypothetical protein
MGSFSIWHWLILTMFVLIPMLILIALVYLVYRVIKRKSSQRA